METPWGRWSVLKSGVGFQVKLLEIEPGQRLSYQTHVYREEHWIVVSGVATITIRGRTRTMPRSGTSYVERRVPHRIENRDDKLLVVVETQLGDIIDEGDIIRLEDDYGRLP